MYEVPGFTFTATTAAKQSDKFVFVKMTSTGIAPATAITDAIVGVVQREGNANEALPVMHTGISMVVASAKIAKGAKVVPTDGGQAVTATAPYCGVALEAASAAGDVIPVLLVNGGETPKA